MGINIGKVEGKAWMVDCGGRLQVIVTCPQLRSIHHYDVSYDANGGLSLAQALCLMMVTKKEKEYG